MVVRALLQPHLFYQCFGPLRRVVRTGELQRNEPVFVCRRRRIRWKDWNPTNAPRRSARSSSFMRVISLPPRRIPPEEGASNRAMSARSVDLPLPDGPVTATNCPRRTSRSRGCRMVSCSLPLVTVRETFVSRIIAVAEERAVSAIESAVKVPRPCGITPIARSRAAVAIDRRWDSRVAGAG